jgi:hypothetical protein
MAGDEKQFGAIAVSTFRAEASQNGKEVMATWVMDEVSGGPNGTLDPQKGNIRIEDLERKNIKVQEALKSATTNGSL